MNQDKVYTITPGQHTMTHQYIITGEDFVDRTIPESAFTFPYVLCAESLSQAREMFYTIFPSCNIVSCIVRDCE